MKRILYLLLMCSVLAACSTKQGGLKKELVGTWQNPDGFQIQFFNDDAGFIPGVAGSIPDTNFSYTILDESHVEMSTQGQKYTIEIIIDGDTLTWKDSIGEVEYTRVK